MNKYIKPSSIAFYLLIFLLAFIIGAAAAGLSGVAKGQGLAGGAIVLGYGLMTALGGIILGIIIVSRASIDLIKKANWIILALAVIIVVFLRLRSSDKKTNEKSDPQPKIQTSPSLPASLMANFTGKSSSTEIGLGLFTPNYVENNVLYFYSVQNPDIPIEDNPKLDSITFSLSEHGDFTIQTAPPWLQPEHLKLDYGIIYFKIMQIGKDYILLEGNSTTKTTYFVSKWSGDILYWPEFILSTFMLEFPEGKVQPVRIKPLENASIVQKPVRNMRAISVQDSWVEVEILDDQWSPIDKGWIRWRDESKILIKYSLLS
ncbi:hypothetical protein FHS59_001172 [Algoriphagus iocasae]|uniref:Uncharacterized protein n=1 Tax=Algoriphagus iocasae TaxID=1836499 RepID=A0A841MJD0_9BACT|nr:hypothetical protein [Algoriphagus iocasae]MBB6325557.1 hypothetical protein [Algoriphagus iocasae]